MRAGADDYLANPLARQDLMLRLIAAERVTRLHRQLEVQTAELERLNGELFEAGRRDALTGVGNRRRMQDDIAALESVSGAAQAPLSVALFDIDRFKNYNDNYSHVAGDDVLKRVAAVLAPHLGQDEGFYR
jgi:PleD family two-component response regulator